MTTKTNQPTNNQLSATGDESPLRQVGKNFMALLARLIPSKEKKLRVEDIAGAMKTEFENRLGKEGDKVVIYQVDDIAALATVP